jgi:hypothetical protein
MTQFQRAVVEGRDRAGTDVANSLLPLVVPIAVIPSIQVLLAFNVLVIYIV